MDNLKESGKFKKKVIGVKSEYKKIIWPSRITLSKQTFSVVCMSLIIGVIIFFYDTIFASLIAFITSIF